MKITFFPKTRLGVWSCCLIAAFAVCIGFFLLCVTVFGQRGGAGFFDNLLLTIPMLIGAGFAATASVTGIFSFFKSERSLLVSIAVLLGLFVSGWWLMEIICSH